MKTAFGAQEPMPFGARKKRLGFWMLRLHSRVGCLNDFGLGAVGLDVVGGDGEVIFVDHFKNRFPNPGRAAQGIVGAFDGESAFADFAFGKEDAVSHVKGIQP